jgi:hypothetical protein
MALNALKHGNIAKINRVFERFVGFVAGFAFAICQSAKVNRMLEGDR